MKKLGVFLLSFTLTVYETGLVLAAVSAARSPAWNTVPLFHNGAEFILVAGQIPVAALAWLVWRHSRRKRDLEKDFLDRYGNKRNKPN